MFPTAIRSLGRAGRSALLAGLIAFPAAFAAPAGAAEFVLQLNPADTAVACTLGDTLHTVHGVFKLRRGEVRFDPASGAATGQLVVDANSGASGSDGRDHKMHKTVLESARFPDIVFTPDRVEGKVAIQGPSEVRVHGIFTIHGQAHEMVLPVKVDVEQGKLTATTTFDVPYVKWGMKNPSVLFLRVSDSVQVSIHATGHLVEATGRGAAVSGSGA